MTSECKRCEKKKSTSGARVFYQQKSKLAIVLKLHMVDAIQWNHKSLLKGELFKKCPLGFHHKIIKPMKTVNFELLMIYDDISDTNR